MRIRIIGAAALLAAAGLAAPAQAADFLGIPLWESYPGQYSYGPRAYYYSPRVHYHYDPFTGHYHRHYY